MVVSSWKWCSWAQESLVLVLMAFIAVLVVPFQLLEKFFLTSWKTFTRVLGCRLTHLRQASLIVSHLLLQTRGAPSLPISVLQITWSYRDIPALTMEYVWALGIFSGVRSMSLSRPTQLQCLQHKPRIDDFMEQVQTSFMFNSSYWFPWRRMKPCLVTTKLSSFK